MLVLVTHFSSLLQFCRGGGVLLKNNLISRPGSKVLGSPELIFFGLKQSLQNILLKCVSQELQFSQNRQNLGLKMQMFSKNKSGVSGARKGFEMVEWKNSVPPQTESWSLILMHS